ncbi:MAG: TIGR03936 family radical SAM-associated protein [Clostridiaceae bacterium]|nr:TIGR03936 family radical SAM-associated protein [Eubacteriales bacterium]
MRIIARFEKTAPVRFVSHLDVQRLFQRAFRRALIPAAYSQGFNPHPVLAFATALSTGFTSSAEWLDLKLEREIEPDDFIKRVNTALPAGFRVIKAALAEDALPALSALMCATGYTVRFLCEPDADALTTAIRSLLGGEIVVNKKTKAGRKDVDLRPQLYEMVFFADRLAVTGEASAQGSLSVDLLMEALFARLGTEYPYSVHRDALFSKDGRIMPRFEAEKYER